MEEDETTIEQSCWAVAFYSVGAREVEVNSMKEMKCYLKLTASMGPPNPPPSRITAGQALAWNRVAWQLKTIHGPYS
jgi:hypothetical protein